MAAPKKNVAFAQEATTIHVKLASEPGTLPDGTEAWDIESRILNAGESVSLSDLPDYLAQAVRSGTAPGLIAITEAQAKKAANFKNAAEMAFDAFSVSEEQESDPNFPAEEY